MPKGRFKNLADTVTSFFYNEATAIRNYLFPDKDGTVAMVEDLDLISVDISGATTLDDTAFGKLHLLSGASDYTVALPAASGNADKSISFRATASLTAVVTVDGNSAETINSIITRSITKGGAFTLYCDGSNWQVINEIPSDIAYSPTITGFSSFTSQLVRYSLIGKMLTLKIAIQGTSNATDFTVTLPANMVCNEYVDGVARIQNNGTAAAGRFFIGTAGSTVTFNATVGGGAFTGSGTKTGFAVFTIAIQ